MNNWSGNQIDPVSNIAHQRIYVFTGTYDNVVTQNAATQVVNLYKAYTASTNIRYDSTIPAGHAFPTDFDHQFANQFPCGTIFPLTNCGFDGAGISLQWFYGTLNARNTGAPSGTLHLIDQRAFAPSGIGLDEVALLYVPAGCANGEACRLHVFLHGCGQSYADFGNFPVFANYSGHRMWADTNNIVLLFPQTLSDARNPDGCWAQSLFYGDDFDQKTGLYIVAIMAMVNRITSGYQPPPTASNYQGLWYNAPAESEAGWGINFAHQGDVIFATWFTYDAPGRAWWLTMTANKTAEGVYTGTLNQTRGPPFNAQPFTPALVTVAPVGTGTVTFHDANNGSFTYTVNGLTQTKAITRQFFGPLPTCVFGAQPNLALATNFQDLWYAAPAESEAGWGVNFTHQGDIIFATWFTYDFDSNPLWLSGTANKAALGVYNGTLNRTTGPEFSANPWNKNNVTVTPVGTYTLTFANGNSATFRYQLSLGNPPVAVDQTKPVTRQVFRAPGTMCQ